MSQFIKASTVSGLTLALTVHTFILDTLGLKQLYSLNASSAVVTPLSDTLDRYHIIAARLDSKRRVDVRLGGDLKYIIERRTRFSPIWHLKSPDGKVEYVTLHVGLPYRYFDVHTLGIHRDMFYDVGLNGFFSSFYMNDGFRYSWSKSSKYLEKVGNPSAGIDGTRARIAQVRLLRNLKLDFELAVDSAISEDNIPIILATAFISMLTQWGFGDITDTTGPVTQPVPRLLAKNADDDETTKKESVLVIEKSDDFEYIVEAV